MFTETEVALCREATVDNLSIYDILEDHEIEAVDKSNSNTDRVVSCVLHPNYNSSRKVTFLTLKKLMSGFNVREWLYEISNCFHYNQRTFGRCWVS